MLYTNKLLTLVVLKSVDTYLRHTLLLTRLLTMLTQSNIVSLSAAKIVVLYHFKTGFLSDFHLDLRTVVIRTVESYCGYNQLTIIS